MRWQLFAIGKPRLAFAKAGLEEYRRRMEAFTSLEIEFLKAGSRPQESTALLRRSEGTFRILLDEKGEEPTSRALAGQITQWEQNRVAKVSVLIGGAEGHEPTLRDQADWVWSLSKMTLPHELALVVALEQIYRAYAIKAGLPYHRG